MSHLLTLNMTTFPLKSSHNKRRAVIVLLADNQT